jgi:ATP-dependent Clp protease adapter protein ClpS
MRLDEIRPEVTVIDRPPVKQREEVPLHVPGGATVMILNDDVTPAEVVVEAIMYGTGLSAAEAQRRMEQSHQGGWAAVASYASRDLAETVASKIENHARNNTNYDHYRPHIPFNGPWPLAAEVMDAEQ